MCMKVGLRCQPPDERDEAENTAVSRSLRWQLDRVLLNTSSGDKDDALMSVQNLHGDRERWWAEERMLLR